MSAKEMDIASQLSFADGRWHFTMQAWCATERGADAVIQILNIIKPLLAENEDATALTATEIANAALDHTGHAPLAAEPQP